MFSIPPVAAKSLLNRGVQAPQHLAYVEWFTAFPANPEPNHLMYKISRCVNRDGDHLASIVPVSNIWRSVHLFPKFGPIAPREWKSSTVLDECRIFYVSSFLDRHTYATLY